jgi:hypothetical protein
MKLRIGACALMLAVAGCSGDRPESGVAGMRDIAATKASRALPTSLPLARAIGASIANAPDRGALLSYTNKATPAKQEGAYTWYPTAISEAHAFKGIATGEMSVPSPDGTQVKLRYERHVEEIDGNWTWIGRVVGGDPMQEAIITFGEKAVFGSIPQANGKPALSLQTRDGAVFAVQTDPSKVVSATAGHVDIMVPEASALRSSMSAAVSQSAQVTQAATAVAQGAPPTAANTIDVAIGYTPEFATANNGASGAATRLVYLIQVGNQALVNSSVNGYLRIVNAVQVSYTNTNTNQTALQELTGSTGQAPVTVPASLAPLRTARDQYGADIAVLVRKFSTPENEGCGIAWLNGANRTAITAADASWGYAVISDGYDQGTDGKTYYCADETLVHEAAHLMGSAHDRANSRDGNDLQYGRFDYSFGLKTAAASGNFYTVMAYGDTGQISHRIFSTPLKSTCGSGGNLPCGVANTEDNARSLNQMIPVVATFRATVVPFTNARNDFDGDGRSDILWNNASTGASAIWKAADHGSQQAVRQVADLNWRKVGVGDFDGDGKYDILFRNVTTGANTVWRAGNYATQTAVASVPNLSWQVGGVGDFNGDGRSDILWRNVSSGANSIWLSSNSSTQQYVTTVGGNWSVVGVGDFDGDGEDDIFWRNTDGSNAIWRSGQYSDYQSVDAVPGQAWQVVGVGDFDGDSVDDVLWRNRSTGFNTIWKGAVSSQRITIANVTDTRWRVASVADFDGDGRDDILWRNTGTGANVIWKAASNASQQAVVSVTSQAWVVVR